MLTSSVLESIDVYLLQINVKTNPFSDHFTKSSLFLLNNNTVIYFGSKILFVGNNSSLDLERNPLPKLQI